MPSSSAVVRAAGAAHEGDREGRARLLERGAQPRGKPLVAARVRQGHRGEQGAEAGQPPQDGPVRADQERAEMAAGRGLYGLGVLQQLERRLYGPVADAQLLGEVTDARQPGVRLVVQQKNRELPGREPVARQEALVEGCHGRDSNQDSGY